jgi:nucleoside-triphosphatase THEP1
VERDEPLCVCGPSGTGKSHLVEALGYVTIDRGKQVAWHTVATLAALVDARRTVRRHRADDTVAKVIARLICADLMVIDDVGMLPVSSEAAEALFRSSTPPTSGAPWPLGSRAGRARTRPVRPPPARSGDASLVPRPGRSFARPSRS